MTFMNGPGIYDKEATEVFHSVEADVVCLMVCGGNRGSGFSVSIKDPRFACVLPIALRRIAMEIERDLGWPVKDPHDN